MSDTIRVIVVLKDGYQFNLVTGNLAAYTRRYGWAMLEDQHGPITRVEVTNYESN